MVHYKLTKHLANSLFSERNPYPGCTLEMKTKDTLNFIIESSKQNIECSMGLLFKGPWVRLLLSHSDQLPLTFLSTNSGSKTQPVLQSLLAHDLYPNHNQSHLPVHLHLTPYSTQLSLSLFSEANLGHKSENFSNNWWIKELN